MKADLATIGPEATPKRVGVSDRSRKVRREYITPRPSRGGHAHRGPGRSRPAWVQVLGKGFGWSEFLRSAFPVRTSCVPVPGPSPFRVVPASESLLWSLCGRCCSLDLLRWLYSGKDEAVLDHGRLALKSVTSF